MAAVSFGKQNPSTTSTLQIRGSLFLHHAAKVRVEFTKHAINCIDSNQHTRANTSKESKSHHRSSHDHSWQQSALVSRIQVQLRHYKSEGPCFCIMLPKSEWKSQKTLSKSINRIVSNQHTRASTSKESKSHHRSSHDHSRQQSALVSRIQVQLRHYKSEGLCFCIMLPKSEWKSQKTLSKCINCIVWNQHARANTNKESKTHQRSSHDHTRQQSALVSRIQVQLRH